MSQNIQSINISSQNIAGKCDVKCSYTFNYPETNLTAKNNGNMIRLTCDYTNTSPVLYNSEKYNVSNIFIIAPSIHIFNNEITNAEILIEHDSLNGGAKLFVCIPIIESSNTTTASNLITEIINNVASNAPRDEETTNINISNFTLNSIVPKKPFFSYTGTDINNSISEFIVFGIIEAIPLSSDTLSSLKQIIQALPMKAPGNLLFFNSSGPQNASDANFDDGIYISCNPTGSSQEKTDINYEKNTTNNNLGSLLKNPIILIIIQIILGCILFLALFMILNYTFTKILDYNVKIPKIS
jgi:carbonic anhydrase